jgi:hypothetical protein
MKILLGIGIAVFICIVLFVCVAPCILSSIISQEQEDKESKGKDNDE